MKDQKRTGIAIIALVGALVLLGSGVLCVIYGVCRASDLKHFAYLVFAIVLALGAIGKLLNGRTTTDVRGVITGRGKRGKKMNDDTRDTRD